MSLNIHSLSCQKALFSLDSDVHYLNCATMSPNLKSVENSGIEGVILKSNPYKITQETFIEITEPLKKAYAQLINCSEFNRICIVPSTSYPLAIIAKNIEAKINLKTKNEIVWVGDEFPSLVYAWEEICEKYDLKIRIVAAPNTSLDRGKTWNESLLSSITKNTCLVVLSPVHWTDGTKFDLISLKKVCQDNQALLIIDGTQAIGAIPFDLQEIQPDAIVNAGYKWLLGPYSLGLAYFGAFFDEGSPIERNWINRKNSGDFKNLTQYQTEYKPFAERYNMGERSNFILVPMLNTAIEQINRWTPKAVQSYCQNLTHSPLSYLKNKGFWIENADFRYAHLIGIKIPSKKSIEKIKSEFEKKRIYVSFRADFIRISTHVFNTENDFDVLVDILLNYC